jgi:hypothetical protein
MFDVFSKREITAIIVATIVVCAVSAWGTLRLIDKYLIGQRDDPLTRAGGLKADQMTK